MAQKALIIGAGLAGTCLAHQLLAKGISVKMLDQGRNNSSAIAAGMVNPMVFRRMNKSWRLDEFLPEAQQFYLAIEKKTEYQDLSSNCDQAVLFLSTRAITLGRALK